MSQVRTNGFRTNGMTTLSSVAGGMTSLPHHLPAICSRQEQGYRRSRQPSRSRVNCKARELAYPCTNMRREEMIHPGL